MRHGLLMSEGRDACAALQRPFMQTAGLVQHQSQHPKVHRAEKFGCLWLSRLLQMLLPALRHTVRLEQLAHK